MKQQMQLAERKTTGWLERAKRELIRNRYIYLLALPVIVYYILFYYLPMFGIVIAFKQFELGKGVLASRWVGLKYFHEYFASNNCWRTIRNTLLISFYNLLFGFPMPIIFALLMNEIKKSWFKKTVQTITYLPRFISLVVVCSMITDFLTTDGAITKLLVALGGEKTNYLGKPEAFRSIYVISEIWQNMGWSSIIYLAALAGVSTELYEAATVDGAGRFRQLLSVTLPGIAPTVITMLILSLGQVMSVGFEKIILLYGPATYETADVISSFVYRRGLGESAQYSFSSAVGLFQSVVNLLLLLSADFMSKKFTETSLLG